MGRRGKLDHFFIRNPAASIAIAFLFFFFLDNIYGATFLSLPVIMKQTINNRTADRVFHRRMSFNIW